MNAALIRIGLLIFIFSVVQLLKPPLPFVVLAGWWGMEFQLWLVKKLETGEQS